MLRGLARTLKLGKEKFYVGVDLQGNSFYERPSPNGDPENWRHSKRTVVYTGPIKPLSDYTFHSLPVQWNSWLRRTRKDPPTLNELEIDFFRQQSVQQNVERLAIEYKEEKLRLVEPNVAELLAEGEERRKAREREIVDRIRGEEEKEIKSYKLGQIKIGQHEDEGLDQVEVKTTDRQRTQAKLRRELELKESPKPKGNPDEDFQPASWSPAPRKR